MMEQVREPDEIRVLVDLRVRFQCTDICGRHVANLVLEIRRDELGGLLRPSKPSAICGHGVKSEESPPMYKVSPR